MLCFWGNSWHHLRVARYLGLHGRVVDKSSVTPCAMDQPRGLYRPSVPPARREKYVHARLHAGWTISGIPYILHPLFPKEQILSGKKTVQYMLRSI